MDSINQSSCGGCCSDDAPVKGNGQQTDLTNTKNTLQTYWPAIISFVLLAIGLVIDSMELLFFKEWIRILWYAIAYLPVGLPVIKQGYELLLKGNFFSEFTLMVVATLGAFSIGEYPEGVAVMLFYCIGELFQEAAVKKARGNIRALLDLGAKHAMVYMKGRYEAMNPEVVAVGSRIQIKAGEKFPLDGVLKSEKATVNTAAITGESIPKTLRKGEKVYAGYLNVNAVVEMESTKIYQDSSIARILDMVEKANSRKSKTELFIRKFAKIYTPIVFFAAVAITFLPYLIVTNYVFEQWLYRGLIFLVISCPCALVVSIPLGYFGGLGAASRNGLLFKGASFLDAITKVNTLVLDKTGTLTKGNFKIKAVHPYNMDKISFLNYLNAIESQSTHPVAKAITAYHTKSTDSLVATQVTEVAGKGLKGMINGQEILAGNAELLKTHRIQIPSELDLVETVVFMAVNGVYVGYLVIADELKPDTAEAIEKIKATGIHKFLILSGDKQSITTKLANYLGIKNAKGDLLPEDKLEVMENLKEDLSNVVAFVGDGINDAPVLALSDVGIAMGALGSDVAIETADIVIQTDQPTKIATAIKIGKSTRRIIWQNISLAFGVKLIVLLMGAGGIATMWEAVFADVGVALLAILNAVRLQRMTWD